jgi:hypothetical protein
LDSILGPHTCNLFSIDENNHCFKFYFVHCCRGTSGVNAFGFDWSLDNCWTHAPFRRIIGQIWRKLREHGAKATVIIPLWASFTWWHLIAPDAVFLSEFVVDWIWLPRNDPSLFANPGWSSHLTAGLANYGLAG